MRIAFACRYGHQPLTLFHPEPLTVLDFRIFNECLNEWFDREVSPRKEMGIPSPADD